MEEPIVSAAEAVQLFIEHVDVHDKNRQKAKKRGETYKPSNEERVERQRLMMQMLAALDTTRGEIIHRLAIDRATWDRWRTMITLPQRQHLEALSRIAAGGTSPIEHSGINPLMTQATEAMLQAVGITLMQLEGLEWLIKMQYASPDVPFDKEVCATLLTAYGKTREG